MPSRSRRSRREGEGAMSPGRELGLVALLFGALFLLGAISPIRVPLPGEEPPGLTDAQARRAYALAWEISDELEEWSNWIVDGDGRFAVTKDEWDRAFRRVEELIELLCRELGSHRGECRYEGY